MGNLEAPLSVLLPDYATPPKRGRKPKFAEAMTNAIRHKRSREGKQQIRLRRIAILDMETDPFDPDKRAEILPFVAELYSDQFGSIVVWDEDFNSFVEKLIAQFVSLTEPYTIYAHNGGKFDFMFLVRHLRGIVKFKGRAIMSAFIGIHELRDSLHILPEKLAAWKKDHFDYSKMRRCNRSRYRQEILDYLHSDCIYLFDIVRSFLAEFGFKISIGQAAFSELKRSYKVTHLSEQTDEFLRRYFFGGRVECIQGSGLFLSSDRPEPYKLYDVNSMYPHCMAHYRHPIGSDYLWRRGEISEHTVFVDVECRNFGAFVQRTDSMMAEVANKTDRQRYYVTIWEYETALRHGLISDVEITGVVDNMERTTFDNFIVPMYLRRQAVKVAMHELKLAGSQDAKGYEELKKQDLFLKYLLNNAYGKFAQNPRNFKEYYYTEPGTPPPDEWLAFLRDWRERMLQLERSPGSAEYRELELLYHKFSMPVERDETREVWAKPSPSRRFNNVGTAASITGAARAMLLDAIMQADDPIYCDTDSLICRSLDGFELSPSLLGAWKIEHTFDEIIIAGKKQYACKVAGLDDRHERRLIVRCKGANIRVKPDDPDAPPEQWERDNGRTWQRYLGLLNDETIVSVNVAPTFTRLGKQYYLTRNIRATAPRLDQRTIGHAS